MPSRPFASIGGDVSVLTTTLQFFSGHLHGLSRSPDILRVWDLPTETPSAAIVSSMPSLRRAFAVAAVLFAAKTPMPRSYAQKMPKASHAFTAKMCAGGFDSFFFLPDFVGECFQRLYRLVQDVCSNSGIDEHN